MSNRDPLPMTFRERLAWLLLAGLFAFFFAAAFCREARIWHDETVRQAQPIAR